jgi:hypothetical protein
MLNYTGQILPFAGPGRLLLLYVRHLLSITANSVPCFLRVNLLWDLTDLRPRRTELQIRNSALNKHTQSRQVHPLVLYSLVRCGWDSRWEEVTSLTNSE